MPESDWVPLPVKFKVNMPPTNVRATNQMLAHFETKFVELSDPLLYDGDWNRYSMGADEARVDPGQLVQLETKNSLFKLNQ